MAGFSRRYSVLLTEWGIVSLVIGRKGAVKSNNDGLENMFWLLLGFVTSSFDIRQIRRKAKSIEFWLLTRE